MVVSDSGTKLALSAILKRQEDRLAEWYYVSLGNPMQNGYVVNFRGDPGNDHLLANLSHTHHLIAACATNIAIPLLEPRWAHPVGVSPTFKRAPSPEKINI